MSNSSEKIEKKYTLWIWVLSIIIPVAVAVLFMVKIPGVERLGFLPPIYATTNAMTAVLLILALVMIKKEKRYLHELFMKSAVVLSVIFLVLYVVYHMTSESTPYGGEGAIRTVYFFLLISHILLSITVIPFVLITYVRAISRNFKMHKKIARITFPIWLYVAVTGVIIYFMISPYY
ncbi:hypothetical protein SCB49_07677 [unidentified eubacterium SCB49]|nr:hypothetical protein SCB49_07677 [unidentified eubacterium SCB49]